MSTDNNLFPESERPWPARSTPGGSSGDAYTSSIFPSEAFKSDQQWGADRPRVLVVACSDGRLQKNLDDFLEHHLGITHYDRMYLPGGPGGLVTGGYDFMRADQFHRECAFLLTAHGTEEIILIFHGASSDGPEVAICADYKRKMPGRTSEEINAQQHKDLQELFQLGFNWPPHIRVRAYRGEVASDGTVRFIELGHK